MKKRMEFGANLEFGVNLGH